MIDIVIRSVIGYLTQVVPCAVLALLPFRDNLALPRKAAAVRFAVFLALLCAVFTVANAMPVDPVPANFTFMMELVFYATLAVFFRQYCRVVDAITAKKAFAFLLAMAYGCTCLMACYVPGLFLVEDHHGDGRMYLWSTLPITITVGAVMFVPAYLFAKRVISPYLSLDLDEREWWGQCIIPASIVASLVGGIWLPEQLDLPESVKTGVLVVLELAFAVALLALMTIAYRRVRQGALRHGGDDEAAGSVTQTGESQAGEASREVVTIGAPTTLIRFHADEATYLEVFNHTLVVHLKGGREERANVSLSKAAGLLPGDRFIQCHRSYLVNLAEVRSLVRYELTLSDGVKVPVSKQRYQEVRAALEGLGGSRPHDGDAG